MDQPGFPRAGRRDAHPSTWHALVARDQALHPEERLILAIAVVLSVTMFGWQGYHLVWAHGAASHERTTELVEAVHSTGRRQLALVEGLEHDVLVTGQALDGPELAGWADRYAAASARTQDATSAALDGSTERLADVVGTVEAARSRLDGEVDRVLTQLSTGGRPSVAAALLDPEYLAAQDTFRRAVDSQLAGLAVELEATTAAERRNELQAVVIALVLFTAAIGAWLIFVRRLRRSRRQLAEEHTQRREAEAALSQLQKMEALGLMADGVAHDVKNLAAIISGSAAEARRGLPAEHPAAAALARIEEATRQADDVARDLLAFSRKAESRQGAVDLASLAVGMTQLLRYMVPAPVVLTVEAPPAAWVHGDAVQLQQVIFNLAANARDAMPAGGTLTIAVRPSPSDAAELCWLLVVDDTGEGMTPDVERHLFEPFFTTRPAGRGSGLGLAIVNRIVREHRGWIDVSTRPGQGSTVTVGLPALPDPAPTDHTPAGGGSLVLVANPVPHVRDLMIAALVADGYRTLPASTEDDVAAALARHGSEIDLAIIDAEHVRQGRIDVGSMPSNLPIVLTGSRAADVGPDGQAPVRVLEEPWSLAALTRSVEEMLRPCDVLIEP